MNREFYFDNAKLFLIFLVVFGHSIQPLIGDSKIIEVLYYWIYFFHMPAFVFLSGFFAKGFGTKNYIVKLAKKLLYPYLIFQLFYTIYYYAIGMNNWQTTVYEPQWALWFLLSLFCWNMLLIVFKKLPAILGVIIATEIAIIIGYIDSIGHIFSLSRTFVFFPFFLIGYFLTKEHVLLVKSKIVKITSLIVLPLVGLCLAITPNFSVYWLLGSQSYEAMGAPLLGGLFRFGVYLVALLMAVCVMAWIPRKQTIVTNIGQKTLYIYLLHGLFIQYFREAELFNGNSLIDAISLVFVSIAIILVLSNKLVISSFQLLIEGRVTILKSILGRRIRKHNYDY
ncbi:acyltransferase family protein [Aquibacillus rhizosphaerae]|uniref:Acyltransferase family protein n=1 Tax=Aquibacillus rhizosphaerae TaxID=3051431 RepID=A0ABT7L799_9BACI|nr:acyltransferase family protein [Aquibacillus sp. LR5S19]MDL4841708.1 acyltransferase family protein [Aquibacillus sp. LR5S19]